VALRDYDVSKHLWAWALVNTTAAYSIVSRRFVDAGLVGTQSESPDYPFTNDEDRITMAALRQLGVPNDNAPYATVVSVEFDGAICHAVPVLAYDLHHLSPANMVIGTDILHLGIKHQLGPRLPGNRPPIDKLVTYNRLIKLD
jgi:hypothetical protein